MVQPSTMSPMLPYLTQETRASEKNTPIQDSGNLIKASSNSHIEAENQNGSWMRTTIKVAGAFALIGGVYAGMSYLRSGEPQTTTPLPQLPEEFYELLKQDKLNEAIEIVERVGKENPAIVGPAFLEMHEVDKINVNPPVRKRNTIMVQEYLLRHAHDTDIVSQEAIKAILPLSIDDWERTPLVLATKYVGKEDPFSQSMVDAIMDILLKRPRSYKLHHLAGSCIRENDAACQRAIVNTFKVVSELGEDPDVLKHFIKQCQQYKNPICKDFVL
jgi:hypothetical protein